MVISLLSNHHKISLLHVAVNKAIIGIENMELIEFDMQQESVAIHQPLVRLLAGGH